MVFHPGYYIKELIEDYNITQEEFVEKLEITPKIINDIINGDANISNELAKKLSNMVGVSSELWLNLQKKYDAVLNKIEMDNQLAY
ncbi:MAG: HigA family addiction module antidote protein [Fusobacteriaceae bacterium]|nr:HigA family addiction module antidote protein [Fusobacteriaceae bacterium]